MRVIQSLCTASLAGTILCYNSDKLILLPNDMDVIVLLTDPFSYRTKIFPLAAFPSHSSDTT